MKSILITGSTDGIGKLTALKLAKEGHRLFIHGRNTAKLKKAILELKEQSGNRNISGFIADFSKLAEVRKMAEQIKSELDSLDILINNAGIFMSTENKTEDGFDIRFSVNYLAPYLLTQELLPLLKKGQKPRIINLSSAAQSAVSYKALAGSTYLSVNEAYAQSKLALTMWSFHLAKKESDIQVFAVNPGSLLNTKMAKEAYGQHWAPAEKGANIIYDLAVSEEFSGQTGKYFNNDKGTARGHFAQAHPKAYDPMEIDQLILSTKTILA